MIINVHVVYHCYNLQYTQRHRIEWLSPISVSIICLYLFMSVSLYVKEELKSFHHVCQMNFAMGKVRRIMELCTMYDTVTI